MILLSDLFDKNSTLDRTYKSNFSDKPIYYFFVYFIVITAPSLLLSPPRWNKASFWISHWFYYEFSFSFDKYLYINTIIQLLSFHIYQNWSICWVKQNKKKMQKLAPNILCWALNCIINLWKSSRCQVSVKSTSKTLSKYKIVIKKISKKRGWSILFSHMKRRKRWQSLGKLKFPKNRNQFIISYFKWDKKMEKPTLFSHFFIWLNRWRMSK